MQQEQQQNVTYDTLERTVRPKGRNSFIAIKCSRQLLLRQKFITINHAVNIHEVYAVQFRITATTKVNVIAVARRGISHISQH